MTGPRLFSPDDAARLIAVPGETDDKYRRGVLGVVTGDMGLQKDGTPGPNYQPGMELRARYTLFAEGCRGHLGKRLEQRFNLREGRDPQAYGIGIKELWEIDPAGE